MTKAKGGNTTPADLAKACCKLLGWKLVIPPSIMIAIFRGVKEMLHEVKKRLGFKVSGFPTHLLTKIAQTEQTFNNSKAHEVLGFEPKISVSEATTRICTLYKNTHGSTIFPAYFHNHFLVFLVCVPLFGIGILRSGQLGLLI